MRFLKWLQRRIPKRVSWNGYPPIRGRKIRRAIRIAQSYGLVVTSTTGGSHAPGSWHYVGRGVDVASSSVTQMKRAQRAILRDIGVGNILELFGPANSAWVKNGVKIQGVEGSALETQHDNHIHIAI